MHHEVKRRAAIRLLGLLAAVTLALVGCSSTPPDVDDPTEDPGVDLQWSTSQESVMIPAGSPEEVTTQLSAVLVESSPAVVVLDDSATDPPQSPFPVLAVSGDTSPAARDLLAAEIKRLGAETVLAVGPDAEAVAAQLPVTVVTDAAELPEVSPPTDGSGGVVVTAGEEISELTAPTRTAISTMATASGTPHLATGSGDPREPAATVTAAADAEPGHVIGVGSGLGDQQRLADRVATAATGVHLPGGGQVHDPSRLYIALYGHPGVPSLGVLGEQDLDASVTRARERAADYQALTGTPVIPMFEIIATVATAAPGPADTYTNEVDPESLRPWIERALAEDVYVVLDLQPGRADLLAQAQRYQPLLAYPNVGLALDPEWKLGPDQRPLQQIGQVSAAEVNRVSDWLAEYTRTERLPQKLLVLHQFQTRMLPDRTDIVTDHDELQVLIHVDGQGPQGAKRETWATITADAPPHVTWGWKDFHDEDQPMLTPTETLRVSPRPMMISYQ